MADTPTENSLSILDEEEEDSGYSFADLYKMLVEAGDIILTIDAGSEEALKKGISQAKWNANEAAEKAGEKKETRTIEYKVIPPAYATISGENAPVVGQVKVQVYFKARTRIVVHAVTKASGF